jgi:ribosomal protein L19E
VPHFEAGTQIKKKKQKEGEEREGGRKKGRKEAKMQTQRYYIPIYVQKVRNILLYNP